jgi:2-amino-4-hydroxy-6-hydroxymethyldihydropteridine diphosphokinase
LSEADNYSSRGIYSIYVAIGSNISPEENIKKAADNLNLLFPSIRYSSAWESPPANGVGADFINFVAEVYSSLSPKELKNDVFGPLEIAMGRLRTEDKNAPRTIDIDIIIYNNQIIDAEIAEQPHVIVPLAEINPTFKINNFESAEVVSRQFIVDGRILSRNDILHSNLGSN